MRGGGLSGCSSTRERMCSSRDSSAMPIQAPPCGIYADIRRPVGRSRRPGWTKLSRPGQNAGLRFNPRCARSRPSRRAGPPRRWAAISNLTAARYSAVTGRTDTASIISPARSASRSPRPFAMPRCSSASSRAGRGLDDSRRAQRQPFSTGRRAGVREPKTTLLSNDPAGDRKCGHGTWPIRGDGARSRYGARSVGRHDHPCHTRTVIM
jgi:hypothetical protein